MDAMTQEELRRMIALEVFTHQLQASDGLRMTDANLTGIVSLAFKTADVFVACDQGEYKYAASLRVV